MRKSGVKQAISPHRPAETDDRLIAACIAGDEAAWSRLVDRYSRLVYAIPRRYGLPSEACDDVFQQVFAAALSHLRELRDRQSIAKWMITTARRECGRVIERSRRERDGAALSAAAGLWVEPPEEELSRLERRHAVARGLARLGEPCESLLRMLFAADGPPDYRMIGERMGMPVGSIGPTRARCLARLMSILAQMDEWADVSDRGG